MTGGTGSHPIIALVDHRELTRTALLRSLSEALPGAVFIGAARIENLTGHISENLRAVIFHIDRPEAEKGSLLETVSAAREAISPVPLVTLAESADEESLRASIEGGASAHLTTTMPLEIAACTLRLVMLGGTSFPNPTFLLKRTARCGPVPSAVDGCRDYLSDRLTQREEQVLKLVGEGAQNKIIAYRLNMSENTVKVHLHRILQKFQLHNRTEAALVASTYFAASEVQKAAIEPKARGGGILLTESPTFLTKAS
jgi:DNA-binding NarL/FixJ family response regulator